MEIEGLELKVHASGSNLIQVASDLDTLKTSLATIKPGDSKKLLRLGENISTFVNQMGALDTGKVTAFSGALSSLSALNNIKVPRGLAQSVVEINKVFSNLGDTTQLGEGARKFVQALAPLQNFKATGIANLANGIKKMQEGLAELDYKDLYGKTNSLVRILEPLADVLERIATNFKALPKSFRLTETTQATAKVEESKDTSKWSAAAEMLRSRFSDLLGIVGRVSSAIAGLTGKLLKLAAVRLAPVFNPFKGLAESVKNLNAKLKNTFSSLKRIAVYRAIRSFLKAITQGFKEGIENLYQWSKMTNGDFAPAMDRISTAMLYLKNSIAAMASPLITYLAPAIDMAVDKFVSLINVVNQLFAKITGRPTWTEALKYPKEYAEGVAGATKKIKDNIQSFDELHILTTPNDGGSGDALDYSSMFKESEIENDFANWVEDFKNAIKNGDWEGAGRILGDQVNGLFERIQWGELGKFTAEKINNVFSFAFGFLDQIDFVAIGEDVASFLNNAIETIDAETIGKTMAKKITIAVDFLYGFLKDFDFIEAGHKVSDFVNGWFEEIDGQRIGETISLAIKGALDFGITFLSDDEMIDSFVEDIVGLINGVDWYGIGLRVFTFGEKLLDAIIKVIGGILTGESYNAETGKFEVDPDISGGFRSETQSTWGKSIAEWVLGIPTDGIAGAFGKILGLAFAGAVRGIEFVYDQTGITDTIGGIISDAVYGGHLDENGEFEKRADDYWSIVGETVFAEFASGSGVFAGAIKVAKEELSEFSNWTKGELSELGDWLRENGWAKERPTADRDEYTQHFPVRDMVKDLQTTWFSDDNIVSFWETFASKSKALGGNAIKDVAEWASEIFENKFDKTQNVIAEMLGIGNNKEGGQGDSIPWLSNLFTDLKDASKDIFVWSENKLSKANDWWRQGRVNAEYQTDVMKINLLAKYNNLHKGITATQNKITHDVKTSSTSARQNAEAQVDAMRTNLVAKYGNMNKLLVGNLNNITRNTKNGFLNARIRSEDQVNAMRTNLNAKYGNMNKLLVDNLNNITRNTKNGFSNAKDGAIANAQEMYDKVTGIMSDLDSKMGGSADSIHSKMKNGFEATTEDVTDSWYEMKKYMKDSANAIGKIAEHVGNAVSEGFGQVADSINGMSFEIPSWVKDYGGKEFKPSLKKPGKISIPALATGGIITSPTTALVGEAGREAVLPLESNTGWIDMIANRVNEGNVEEIRLLREQNRLLTEIADKEYSISAKSVFDTVRKENKNFYTRTGRNAFAT